MAGNCQSFIQGLPIGDCQCTPDGQPVGTPSQESSDPIVQMNGQIVTVLCGLTLTSAQILGLLQSKYPNTGWDQETLDILLRNGKRKGIYCVPVVNSGLWSVNLNMVQANPSNSVYQDDCPKIIRKQRCSTTIVSNHGAVYSGGVCS